MEQVARGTKGHKISRVEVVSGMDSSGGVTTIDNIHHEVHEGYMYIASRYVASLANNGTVQLLLDIGEEDVHTVWLVSTGGNAVISLYEDTIVSNDGTSVNVVSINRSELIPSTAAIYHTPTVTNVGTLLLQYASAGGSGGNAHGGALRQGTEFILAAGKKYMLQVQNTAGNAQLASVVVEYYHE